MAPKSLLELGHEKRHHMNLYFSISMGKVIGDTDNPYKLCCIVKRTNDPANKRDITHHSIWCNLFTSGLFSSMGKDLVWVNQLPSETTDLPIFHNNLFRHYIYISCHSCLQHPMLLVSQLNFVLWQHHITSETKLLHAW